MKKFEIIPGILEKDLNLIEKKIDIVKPFAKTIHIDLIDGIFAPNKTFMDPYSFFKYKDDFFLEVHMMVDDPLKYLDSFAKAGFKRFIGHVEKMKNLDEFVSKAENLGEVGLAIDLDTQIETITDYLEDLDLIFLMSVKAGFSGQEFSDKVLPKIKKIREIDDLIPIEIDGGINDKTLPKALRFGANKFVTTSYIFNAKNPSESFRYLEHLLSVENSLGLK